MIPSALTPHICVPFPDVCSPENAAEYDEYGQIRQCTGSTGNTGSVGIASIQQKVLASIGMCGYTEGSLASIGMCGYTEEAWQVSGCAGIQRKLGKYRDVRVYRGSLASIGKHMRNIGKFKQKSGNMSKISIKDVYFSSNY